MQNSNNQEIATLRLKVSCLERSLKNEMSKNRESEVATTIRTLRHLLATRQDATVARHKTTTDDQLHQIIDLCAQVTMQYAQSSSTVAQSRELKPRPGAQDRGSPTQQEVVGPPIVQTEDNSPVVSMTTVQQPTERSATDPTNTLSDMSTTGNDQHNDGDDDDGDEIEYRTRYQQIISDANLPHKYVPVRCIEKAMLNRRVIRLRLRLENENNENSTSTPFVYRGGQYIHLTRMSDGLTRRYSLASCPGVECDGNTIELQVRAIVKGEMTNWLLETDEYVVSAVGSTIGQGNVAVEEQIGEQENSSSATRDRPTTLPPAPPAPLLCISGPDGTGYYRHPHHLHTANGCVSSSDNSDSDNSSNSSSTSERNNHLPVQQQHRILMIGVGTGLAPLWAIARDALIIHRNTHSQIHLFHLNYSTETAYYERELRDLEHQFTNFAYYPCVKKRVPQDGAICRTVPEPYNYSVTTRGVHIFRHHGGIQSVTDHIFDGCYAHCDIYLCGLEKRMTHLEERYVALGADPHRLFRDRFWK